MLARIYQPAKTAMQSGRANTREWVLEFEQGAIEPEALMGWQAIADASGHHRIEFDTKEQAIDFARRNGIPHQVIEPHEPKRVMRAYGDNFSYKRKEPWSH